MKPPRPLLRLFPLFFILLALGAAAVIFFSRAPVLLVTDASFDLLYGAGRIRSKQFIVSLRLFRPVRPVRVSETAGPDLVAISVQAASPGPHAVLFPYRYEAGAIQYLANNPWVSTAVFGGRRQIQAREMGPRIVLTDSVADLYRAGRAAALLSGGSSADIVYFYDDSPSTEGRRAFFLGLEDGGSSSDADFLDIFSSYSRWDRVACVVISGSAADYFEKNSELPAVLFSWADPSFCPRGVKVIFDDSPWALAERAVRKIEKGEKEILLESEIAVLSGRIENKYQVKALNALAKGMVGEE